ncbi:ceramidase domain-containing protein [Luteipulveratus flavus]|uniref:Ceramidase domain-containing protein n=1 Tax=Luteipulveratus flavus TaxID=3031728 RepID=A0ABT6C6M3_9MICO|nr:ceramidase domain-containing protein [Luteipulveratus sp. YIM 133296]MDF8263982.1 ceramidase domain-containing protein [Luteipulveratus sp. YIM 133296]
MDRAAPRPQGPFRPTAVAAAVAVASLTLLVGAVQQHWLGPDVGDGSRFCEAARSGLVRQPANAASNLGFVLAGLLIARHVERHWSSLARPVLMSGYACLVVLLGPGSMAMHATQASLGGLLDLTSMYLVAGFASAYALTRLARAGTGAFVALFVAAVAVAEAVGQVHLSVPVLGHPGNVIFALLLLLALGVELALRRRTPEPPDLYRGLLAIGALAVAFVIWNMGMTGTRWCRPHSWLQGHAVWHLLCAVAAYQLYRYYASERPTTAPARDPKAATIAAYEADAEAYRDATARVSAPVRDRIETFAAAVGVGGHVLEIGSGPGHDALLLESAGVRVDRTDITPAFVRMLRDAGHEARTLDPLTGELGGPYDGVWASAVLLHVARADVGTVLRRLRTATREGGLLHASVKEGEGEGWSAGGNVAAPRHFTYWSEHEWRTALTEAGWQVDALEVMPSVRGRGRWLASTATNPRSR